MIGSDPMDEAAGADYSEDAATFGDRLHAAREALGLSQAQLARRLGIKTQTLQSWEEDRSEPRANKLQMVAGLLNVSIIWLMSGEGPGLPDFEPDPDLNAVLAEIREIRTLQADLTRRLILLERRLVALRS